MIKLYKNLYYYLKVMDRQKVIKLTPNEEYIFKMLKNYRDQLGLKTVMRVAGGWVRDKILGKQSHDIDIALDNMKGEEFVTLLRNLSQNKEEKISGFGVTKFNPELSKHLETATAHIHGLWIDFVNLRSEQYNENSRIPTIEIGTPKQDAQRRDFTINSMFYNIDSEKVQDWTGKGFEDLQNKILRTPLGKTQQYIDPYITFKDDPLRVLRCFRFKSRFNFKVEETIYHALEKQDIRSALSNKVSKERVGTELSGILKAKNPLCGLFDIRKFDLWNIVFEVPEKSDLFKKPEVQNIPQYSFNALDLFLKSLEQNGWKTHQSLIKQNEKEEDGKQKVQKGKDKQKGKKKCKNQYPSTQLQFLMNISTLSYFYRLYQVEIGKTKSNLTTYMVKDQLKYSAKQAHFALHFAETVDKLQQLTGIGNVYQVIRWLRFAQEKWEICLHFLWAIMQIQKKQYNFDIFQLRDFVLGNKFEDSYLVEPPINGNFLTSRGIKGPVIRQTLQNAVIWKITNPKSSPQQFIQQFEDNKEFFMSHQTFR